MNLSLNDVVMPKCYTRAVFVFDYRIKDLENDFIEFLNKFSPIVLGKIVLDSTKPNSGQIIESKSDPHRIFSRANDEKHSVDYYLNCSFQEFDVFPYPAIPTDDCPLIFLHQISLSDGTLLSFGLHHYVSDGHGFFSLIARFSQWVREKDPSKIVPFVHDRSLLKAGNEIQFDHVEYTTIPPSFSFTSIPEMDVIVIKLTKSELFNKLNIKSTNLSMNDVLVAWLTQTISKIRQISVDETIKVGIASDGRITFGLDSNYFGNCNFYLCFQFSMKELLERSIEELAEKINIEKKQRMNPIYMKSALAWIQAAKDVVHPGFQSFCGKDLALTNWSRFPAYQIDFGGGPTKRLSLPPARFDGLILILPTPTDQLELYIGLIKKHAEEFREQNSFLFQ